MSSTPSAPTVVDYYTDLLCVWAWIAQPRLDELQRQWGKHIEVRHRFVDIFGDSHRKITQRWGLHDGFEKFSAHVQHSAAPFEQAPLHSDLWRSVRPRSSLPAHLMLKAIATVYDDDTVQTMALRFRRAFFVEARSIDQLPELFELATECALDADAINNVLQDGRAMAELCADQQVARDLGVKGSPTWVLNDGRQILYGNVGYRILHANIEELLKRPGAEASWC